MFKLRAGTAIVHIPYKGSAPSLTALVSGEVDLSFPSIPAIHGHVKSGRRARRQYARVVLKLLREEVTKWAGVVRVSGAQVD